MTEMDDFIKLSKYIGERFDIVQAGGGNVSVKLSDGTMLIKSSGIYLSEIEKTFGYSKVKNDKILSILNNPKILFEKDKKIRDKICSEYIIKANITPRFKPSIETLLHSMMKKYTIHSHPIVVNSICCRTNWKELISKINFAPYKVALINYRTPGIELALELKQQIQNEIPDIVFLQNHGIIVTANDKEQTINIHEDILNKIELEYKIDVLRYKMTNFVSEMVNKIFDTSLVSVISDDIKIKNIIINHFELLNTLPFCPDKMVYCGILPCFIDSITQLIKYKEKYFDYPRIVVYKNELFYLANNVKKAREIEDVFKFHLISLLPNIGNIEYLPKDEIKFLNNWEAEKYRQKI